jgi:beta-glucosidase
MKWESYDYDKKVASDPNTAKYSEESLVGYRWFDTRKTPVMYPFGYGLTYTAFEYATLAANKNGYGKNDKIAISFSTSF